MFSVMHKLFEPPWEVLFHCFKCHEVSYRQRTSLNCDFCSHTKCLYTRVFGGSAVSSGAILISNNNHIRYRSQVMATQFLRQISADSQKLFANVVNLYKSNTITSQKQRTSSKLRYLSPGIADKATLSDPIRQRPFVPCIYKDHYSC